MAVTLESGTAIHRWRGLSSDTKPQVVDADDNPIPANSIFRELDTGRQFVWTGITGWVRQEQTIETLLMDLIELVAQSVELQEQTMRGLSVYTGVDFFDC